MFTHQQKAEPSSIGAPEVIAHDRLRNLVPGQQRPKQVDFTVVPASEVPLLPANAHPVAHALASGAVIFIGGITRLSQLNARRVLNRHGYRVFGRWGSRNGEIGLYVWTRYFDPATGHRPDDDPQRPKRNDRV